METKIFHIDNCSEGYNVMLIKWKLISLFLKENLDEDPYHNKKLSIMICNMHDIMIKHAKNEIGLKFKELCAIFMHQRQRKFQKLVFKIILWVKKF